MTIEAVNKKVEPILQLDLQERIYVYQLLWQSILKDMQMETLLLTEDQKTEVDKRLERIESGEAKLFSWKEIKQEIKSEL